MRFGDIVIETQQEPDVILALWQRYNAGFEYGQTEARERHDERAQSEHDEQMRQLDEEPDQSVIPA